MLLLTAYLLLPRFAKARGGSRISCVSNLKQVGLAFRMWSNDHDERFPWQTPVAEGGTKEFAHLPYAALHFVVASNEFNTPKILTCRADTNRLRTNLWEAPLHLSLSYFIGLTADETNPQTILSGDRNVSTNASILAGLVTIDNAQGVQWTKDIHRGAGNIGFSDGSVNQLANANLGAAFQKALNTTRNGPVRLSIP